MIPMLEASVRPGGVCFNQGKVRVAHLGRRTPNLRGHGGEALWVMEWLARQVPGLKAAQGHDQAARTLGLSHSDHNLSSNFLA